MAEEKKLRVQKGGEVAKRWHDDKGEGGSGYPQKVMTSFMNSPWSGIMKNQPEIMKTQPGIIELQPGTVTDHKDQGLALSSGG